MPRDPPAAERTIYRITSAASLTSPSTLTVGRQLLVGHNHTSSHTLASSLPRQAPQPTLQSEGARPYSQTAVQVPSSVVDDHRSSKEQSGGRVSASRWSTASSDFFQAPTDPTQLDFDELQKAQGRNLDWIHRAVNSASPPSLIHELGRSIRTRALCTSSDDADWHYFALSSDLPSLNLAEVDAESRTQPSQELIDRLDMVRCLGFLNPVRLMYVSDAGPHGMR